MKTTAEVLAEMDAAFVRRRDQDRAAHERSKWFVACVCDAGLVDDVEPTVPQRALEHVALVCGVCGRVLGPTEIACSCSR